jgi:hypothetical protein
MEHAIMRFKAMKRSAMLLLFGWRRYCFISGSSIVSARGDTLRVYHYVIITPSQNIAKHANKMSNRIVIRIRPNFECVFSCEKINAVILISAYYITEINLSDLISVFIRPSKLIHQFVAVQ